MPIFRPIASAAAIACGTTAIIASSIVPDGPRQNTGTPAEIGAYWAEHLATLRVSVVLWTFAAVALLVFAASIATQLRALGAALSATTLAVAGAAGAACLLAAQAPMSLAVRTDFRTASDGVKQSVYATAEMTFGLLDLAIPVLAILVAAGSLAAVQGVLLPRWVAYPGSVTVVAGLLGAIAPVHGENVGPFEIAEVLGYLLWPVWLVAVGITIAVRPIRVPVDATA